MKSCAKKIRPRGARPTAALLVAATLSLAAAAEKNSERSFGDLNLEELMNVSVTSVSKKEQKLQNTAAAVSVLSNDDLRRSGAIGIVEALRLVPGMDVASANAGQASVSTRGFNSNYANKLLVLVDGRAVYSPLFAGVFWDLQQSMLDDVDRIEVIRGPGATIWGANAVNGVINVVTQSARETQGGLLYGGGGDEPQLLAGVRYGGRIGDHTYYRVFGHTLSRDDHPLANGRSAGDNYSSRQGGFRVDHYPMEGTHATWQSEITATDFANRTSDAYNLNTLGRWSRDWSDHSSVEMQAYYDRTHRFEPTGTESTVDTLDFTLQHRFDLDARHEAIWGLGCRFIDGKVAQTNPLFLVPHPKFNQQLFSAFVQDEIKLVPDKLTLTIGTKLEHNDYTGFEVQPSVHLVFKPEDKQTFWGAISRAVRTPGVVEATSTFTPFYGARFVGPGGGLYAPLLVGNPDVSAEKLWAYELGWRLQPSSRVSVDLALFYNDYHDAITVGSVPLFVPGVPVGVAELPFVNASKGQTHGAEASVTVAPTDTWRLTATYSLLVARIEGPQPFADTTEHSAPRNQLGLRSAHDFSRQLSLDGQFRYVDPIQAVPSYLTADLRLSYRPNDRIEVSLVGQNLLDRAHPEQADLPFAITAEVPRGFYGKLTVRF